MTSYLQAANPGLFWLLCGLAIAFAAVSLAVFFWVWRISRAVSGRTPLTVDALSEGVHLCRGRVTGPSLKAPLTGLPCAWWQVEVWEQGWESVNDRDPDRETQRVLWHSRRNESSNRALLCSHGFTTCAVDADRTTLLIPSEVRDWQGQHYPPEDRAPPAMAGHEAPLATLHGSKHATILGQVLGPKYRYVERIITEHAELFVLGRAQRVDAALWAEEDGEAETGADEPDEAIREPARDGLHPDFSPRRWTAEDDRLQAQDMRASQWRMVPEKGTPYIVATEPPERWILTQALAGRGALGFAAVAAGLAAFMLWARFGAA